MRKEQYIVMPLLAIALIAQAFLFAVTYSNASFGGVERAFPQAFAPAQISPALDRGISVIAENLTYSVNTAVAQAKGPVLSFFGLENYKYGQPRYTALVSQTSQLTALNWNANLNSTSAGTVYAQADQANSPQVLGAFTTNYSY